MKNLVDSAQTRRFFMSDAVGFLVVMGVFLILIWSAHLHNQQVKGVWSLCIAAIAVYVIVIRAFADIVYGGF